MPLAVSRQCWSGSLLVKNVSIQLVRGIMHEPDVEGYRMRPIMLQIRLTESEYWTFLDITRAVDSPPHATFAGSQSISREEIC